MDTRLLKGNVTIYGLPDLTSGSDVIEKISDSKIRITNFLGRYASVEFSVSGNKVSLAQGTQVTVPSENLTTYLYRGAVAEGGLTRVYGYESYGLYYQFKKRSGGGYYMYDTIDGTWDGQFVYSEKGSYLQFPNILIETQDNENLEDNTQIFKTAQVAFIEANADVTDTNTSYYRNTVEDSETRSYKARVVEYDNNTLEFVNFNGEGEALQIVRSSNPYVAKFSKIKGSFTEALDGTRTVTIPGLIVRYMYDNTTDNLWAMYDDGIDVWSKYIMSPGDKFEVFDLYAGGYKSASDYKGDIKGTWTIDGDPSHSVNGGGWTAEMGGSVKTFVPSTIKFDSYAIYNETVGKDYFGNSNGVLWKVDNTVFKNVPREITHSASISLQPVDNNESDEYAKITGNVAFAKNPRYVDSYELYMIPENVSNISGKEDDFSDADKGHVNGVCLTEYEQAVPAALEEGNPNRNFELHIPYDIMKLNENGDNSQFEMTLYAKANYKPETGLAPTFHALTPVTVSIPTGVADLNSDYVRVSGGNGVIFANATVEVFNMAGQKIYEGNDSEIPAAAGVYLVRAAQKTFKVIVK